MAEYIDGEELEGRTIAKVVQNDDLIMFRFTDGSYTGIGIDKGYYGDNGLTFEAPSTRGEKYALGLMSQEEYERLNKEEAEQSQRARDEQELANYVRLRQKFGHIP